MADLVIPVGFGNATLHFRTLDAVKEYTVSHGYALPSTPSTANEDAETIFGGWNAVGAMYNQAVMSTAYTFVGVTVIRQAVDLQEGEFLPNVQGEAVIAVPPPNCCLLVQKRTGVAGRSHRGRFFFPLITIDEEDVDNLGIISGDTFDDLVDQLAFTLDALDTADTPIVLLHHSVEAPNPVTSLVASNLIATQRRRLR